MTDNEKEMLQLLHEVLCAPVNHKGTRTSPWRGNAEPRFVIPYTAKRLPDELLHRIRQRVMLVRAQAFMDGYTEMIAQVHAIDNDGNRV